MAMDPTQGHFASFNPFSVLDVSGGGGKKHKKKKKKQLQQLQRVEDAQLTEPEQQLVRDIQQQLGFHYHIIEDAIWECKNQGNLDPQYGDVVVKCLAIADASTDRRRRSERERRADPPPAPSAPPALPSPSSSSTSANANDNGGGSLDEGSRRAVVAKNAEHTIHFLESNARDYKKLKPFLGYVLKEAQRIPGEVYQTSVGESLTFIETLRRSQCVEIFLDFVFQKSTSEDLSDARFPCAAFSQVLRYLVCLPETNLLRICERLVQFRQFSLSLTHDDARDLKPWMDCVQKCILMFRWPRSCPFRTFEEVSATIDSLPADAARCPTPGISHESLGVLMSYMTELLSRDKNLVFSIERLDHDLELMSDDSARCAKVEDLKFQALIIAANRTKEQSAYEQSIENIQRERIAARARLQVLRREIADLEGHIADLDSRESYLTGLERSRHSVFEEKAAHIFEEEQRFSLNPLLVEDMNHVASQLGSTLHAIAEQCTKGLHFLYKAVSENARVQSRDLSFRFRFLPPHAFDYPCEDRLRSLLDAAAPFSLLIFCCIDGIVGLQCMYEWKLML
eukprot:ANDGO_00458.mRNA.1 hypothetical protein